MTTIGSTYIGVADFYKGQDRDADKGDIINMMRQTNSVMEDAVIRECNEGKIHRHSIISGLPDATWGKLYQGTPNGKSKRTEVKDSTGFMEGRSAVDARMEEIEKNFNAYRLQEAEAHIEAISQELARSFFYESQASAPERITGLSPRFNDLGAENSSQIVDAGGIGSDNTSIWFITWGLNACHMIYPEGTAAGITREDHGKQRILDADGNPYYAYEETFRAHAGVSVADWRKIVRISNIDVSELQAGNVDLYKYMRKAMYKVHGIRTLDTGAGSQSVVDGNFKGGRTAIYGNSDIMEALDALGTNSGSSDNFTRLTPREVEGKEVLTYRGMPLRQVDQLINTEARVV